MIIAIDGPAGSGKSTLAHYIAQVRDIAYLDTGALYRALTAWVLRVGIDPHNQTAVEELAFQTKMSFIIDEQAEGGQRIVVDGIDVSSEIRTPLVERHVSLVSSYPGVRKALLGIQRAIAENQSVVAEGRDIGTVVFPHAELKIFLTADARTRARRRVQQNKERATRTGVCLDDAAFDEAYIQAEIERRDQADATRTLAPLKPHQDAVQIDTSAYSRAEMEELVLRLVDKALKEADCG